MWTWSEYPLLSNRVVFIISICSITVAKKNSQEGFRCFEFTKYSFRVLSGIKIRARGNNIRLEWLILPKVGLFEVFCYSLFIIPAQYAESKTRSDALVRVALVGIYLTVKMSDMN